MTHAGGSSFSKALRETFGAYLFDVGGLVAGFLVAYQLGIFHNPLAPWALALYPAVLGAKGIIQGLLSGRLSTALHLGTISPNFFHNSKSFYKLMQASVVLTFVTAVAMSAISLVFGGLFWGITFAHFPAILSVVLATMSMGLVLLVVTAKLAFFSFTKGLDPDIIVYPIMSTVSSIFITICYIASLSLFLNFGDFGLGLVVFLGLLLLLISFYVLPKSMHDAEFVKTIRESLAALMIVAVIVNLTGTLLRGIDRYAYTRKEFYTIYPAIVGLVSNVGSVVGSTATTRLALGMLKPKLSSMGSHLKNILSAWLASIIMFFIIGLIALTVHGIFTPAAFYSHILVLLVTNIVAVTLIVIISFAIAILTFQKGLDPGNFVIPIENAFAASITTLSLLVVLATLSLGKVI